MDLKLAMLGLLVLVTMIAMTDAGHKKVVIHVPLKVKKLKHTHTVYKTIHHFEPHHHHHDHHDHIGSHSHHYDHHHYDYEHDGEDHEHFHHHGDLHGFHSVVNPVAVRYHSHDRSSIKH